MRRCVTCQQTYADQTLKFCRKDGTPLINDSSAPRLHDSARLPDSRFPDSSSPDSDESMTLEQRDGEMVFFGVLSEKIYRQGTFQTDPRLAELLQRMGLPITPRGKEQAE